VHVEPSGERRREEKVPEVPKVVLTPKVWRERATDARASRAATQPPAEQ
jgi:hypothetical protein